MDILKDYERIQKSLINLEGVYLEYVEGAIKDKDTINSLKDALEKIANKDQEPFDSCAMANMAKNVLEECFNIKPSNQDL